MAGGIRTITDAEQILNAGADKISINSPALENPALIEDLVKIFGSQCIVIGIDSKKEDTDFWVYQYTGDVTKTRSSRRRTKEWVKEVQDRGAGEIVLNCMDQDGVRRGYAIEQLKQMRTICHVPLIASGGAGKMEDFYQVFNEARADGALAASVFHSGQIAIPDLKNYLQQQSIAIRIA